VLTWSNLVMLLELLGVARYLKTSDHLSNHWSYVKKHASCTVEDVKPRRKDSEANRATEVQRRNYEKKTPLIAITDDSLWEALMPLAERPVISTDGALHLPPSNSLSNQVPNWNSN
jgi:hypothetical protein